MPFYFNSLMSIDNICLIVSTAGDSVYPFF